MRFIIGLIAFWLSNFGYMFFLKKKTKLPYLFILPILFTLIGILMFVAGILNMMVELSLILCLGGIILFLISCFKREVEWKKLLSVNFIILLVVFIYITVVCGRMRILHYDNFSHWGLIVKTMFIRDGLPNFENAILEFKNYQPGSACFIYYFGLLTGKTEGSMIIAQNYLLISYVFSLLIFTNSNGKFKNNKKHYVFKALVVVCYLFFLFGNIEFFNLLVDTLIASMTICSFALLYYFRDNLKKAFIYTLPISVYLFLVKNTGIVLVCFNCLGLLLIGFKNKEFKKSFIYAVLTGIITCVFFYIWSRHVSYVYGAESLASKHSLSSANMLVELRAKGWHGIYSFCVLYVKHFFDIFNNLPNKYMIGIDTLLLIMFFLFKKNRKELGFSLILCNVVYLLYYGILGLMYLLSMPWVEASFLAGFDRYMLTIIFVIIGMVLITLFSVAIKEKAKSQKSLVLSLVMIAMFVWFNFDYITNNYRVFLGEQNYKETSAYYFDNLLKTDMYTSYDDSYYYIYAPLTSYGDYGYLNYLSKFKLNTYDVLVVVDTMGIDNDIAKLEVNRDIKIIVVDEDEMILKYIEDNGYQKEEQIYVKKNKENVV